MRLEQLRYFAAVVDAGSIRRAAEQLHVSQPAISEALANLERELGVSLLERTRNGARVTDAARQLLPYLSHVLDGVDRLTQAADHQRQFRPIVRIGTVNAATAGLLVPAIQAFHARHPEAEIEVVNAVGDQIADRLQEGSLDLGLLNRMEPTAATSSRFDSHALLHGRPVVCFRSGSALAAFAEIPRDRLAVEPFIAMRRGFLMTQVVEKLFEGSDHPPKVTCYVDGAEMGKLLVAEGAGVTVLPDYSVAGDPLVREGVLAFRPIADDRTRLALHVQTLRTRFVPVLVREMLSVLSETAAHAESPWIPSHHAHQ